ncbi:acetoacetate--CoA ligase [Moritella marina ATCC 15381]|uniref:Acetoacetate--CoA ligase n=1 Tax=Moritella marina ATCC 15381 TaxID=1202962 RepID=A0A5J6WKR8_MORMI|nr:acetoacetate--CoA ligase [Moritella marina]QFI37878.1 acetoacetate--CoA ligase [Moritella marina ATCC 15381]
MTAQSSMPIWTPSQARIDGSNITRYQQFLRDEYSLTFSHYQQLHQWSIDNTAVFWGSLVRFFQLKGHFNLERIFVEDDCFYHCQWFPDSTLNFAENLLYPKNIADLNTVINSNVSNNKNNNNDNKLAIISHGEDGRRSQLSYKQLRDEVTRVAGAIRELGIVKGDRVAAILPNCSEAIVAMLATTSIGAIWSSCSPDFGHQGVLDRFTQIQPKLLFACNGYHYAGKAINITTKVTAITHALPELRQLIIVPYLTAEQIQKSTPPDLAAANVNATDNPAVKHCLWQYFSAAIPRSLSFAAVKFSDPLYILYSSGTTGMPKCIVHSVGGTLLQHVKELALHTDVQVDDRIFYYTTCGWMMWNWLVSSLSQGATLVLFDGSPFHPHKQILFELADTDKVSIFGASAKYYSACDKAALRPVNDYDLRHLKTLLSTGSPLSHESFDYIYQYIKKDLCVSSISGGTDIISCFTLGMPILPVYRGELQCLGLGMDVAFMHSEGSKQVAEGKGELVCRQAFPSMPTGFWQDPGDRKYHHAYFSRFDNIWAHGDYGELIYHYIHPQETLAKSILSQAGSTVASDITEVTGSTEGNIEQIGVIIHGRSDAVLNPGGVRIGTAEIYRQVEKLPEIQESIAIGQQWQDDVRVILFVRLSKEVTLGSQLIRKIKHVIRSNTSPRHVPAKIIAVADIPKTISGKIVELAVRNVVHGIAVTNKDALANPEALALFANLAELQY